VRASTSPTIGGHNTSAWTPMAPLAGRPLMVSSAEGNPSLLCRKLLCAQMSGIADLISPVSFMKEGIAMDSEGS
jgi:hypothetical protein